MISFSITGVFLGHPIYHKWKCLTQNIFLWCFFSIWHLQCHLFLKKQKFITSKVVNFHNTLQNKGHNDGFWKHLLISYWVEDTEKITDKNKSVKSLKILRKTKTLAFSSRKNYLGAHPNFVWYTSPTTALSTLTQVEPVAHSLQRESILAAVVPFCYPVTENCLALLMPFQIIGVLDWPEVKRGIPWPLILC